MWNKLKSHQLQIFLVLAGLAYIVFMGNSFFNGWEDFQRGYYSSAEDQKSGSENYYLRLHSSKGFNNYPDTLINTLNNQRIAVSYQQVIVSGGDELGRPVRVWRILEWMIVFVTFAFIVAIPYHFFKFIRLVNRQCFFESENIRVLRWLGWDLLIIYLCTLCLNIVLWRNNVYLFQLDDYQIVMDPVENIWLLVSLVVFIFAEIISRARNLKEEQDLTI